jgi:hypothetical protein
VSQDEQANWHQTCIDHSREVRPKASQGKDTLSMGLSAILIATALSLTMLLAVAELP